MRFSAKQSYPLMAILLGGLAMLGPLSIDIFLPVVPAMAKKLGIGIGEIELTLTSIFAGGAIGQILYGPLSDRFGRKPVILVALLLFTLSTLAVANSNTIGPIILWRFVQGLLMASGRIIANAAARDQYENETLGKLLSLIFFVSTSASIINPMLGGIIIANFYWQAVFVVMGLYSTVLFVAVVFLFEDTIVKKDPNALNMSEFLNNVRKATKNREFTICVVSGGFAIGAFVSFLTSSSGVANSVFGLGAETFGYYFGGTVSFILLGTLVSNYFVRRAGIDTLIITGGILQGMGGSSMLVFVLLGSTEPLTIFVPMGLFAFGFSIFYPLTTSRALSPFPEMAGTASSLIGFAQNLMGASASGLVALLFDGSAFPMALIIFIGGIMPVFIYLPISNYWRSNQ